ncbi:hypothetical protein QVD17_06921 [Tagetes erecta]|uniref:Uncharacterized protein n=1 Tax=Tagetes erecta TaxID=13708 RepID=A0AAD8LHU2_TARER|nr:hypothetical protein QVD17_06921 [Tagetes erecta]
MIGLFTLTVWISGGEGWSMMMSHGSSEICGDDDVDGVLTSPWRGIHCSHGDDDVDGVLTSPWRGIHCSHGNVV